MCTTLLCFVSLLSGFFWGQPQDFTPLQKLHIPQPLIPADSETYRTCTGEYEEHKVQGYICVTWFCLVALWNYCWSNRMYISFKHALGTQPNINTLKTTGDSKIIIKHISSQPSAPPGWFTSSAAHSEKLSDDWDSLHGEDHIMTLKEDALFNKLHLFDLRFIEFVWGFHLESDCIINLNFPHYLD